MLALIPPTEWTRQTAGHLLARAGFGPTPEQVDECARLTPAEAVERLFAATDITPPPTWISAAGEKRHGAERAEANVNEMSSAEQFGFMHGILGRARGRAERLRTWWLGRMVGTAAPLREKLTLFWHGHFTVQASKVKYGDSLYVQNQLFRERGMASFEELCLEVSRDPAMLRYLDNASSTKEGPSENYAREFLELFTLGDGNYSEDDVREVARAFTGWSIHRERFEFEFRSDLHDDGEKQVLGENGRLGGEDVVRIVVGKDACSRFVARRLWEFFAYENPEDEIVEALAAEFRRARTRIAPLVRVMFLSRAFYSPRAVRTQIKSPIVWLVGLVRALGCELPHAERTLESLRQLGQDLFEPPNVAGWPQGRRWITNSTLATRYEFVGDLLEGRLSARAPSLAALFPSQFASSRADALSYLLRRLFPAGLEKEDRELLERCAAGLDPDPSHWSPQERCHLVRRIASTPQYQLT